MHTVIECLRRTWSIMDRELRLRAAVLLAWMIFGAGCEMAGVGLVVPVLAIIGEEGWEARYPLAAGVTSAIGVESREQLVLLALMALVAVYAVKTAVVIWLTHLQSRFVYGAEKRFSCLLFDFYLRREWAFHLMHNSSELIRNVRSETATFSHVMMGMLNLAADLIVLVALVGLLLAVEPLAAICTGVLALGFGAAFQTIVRPKLERWGDIRYEFEEVRFRHLQQGFGAIREVHLLGRQAFFNDSFRDATGRQLHALQRLTVVQQVPRLGLELMAVTALVVISALMVARGRDLGDLLPILAMFAAASIKILPCASRIIAALSQIQYAAPSVRIVEKEVRIASTQRRPAFDASVGKIRAGSIEIRGLGFRYEDSPRDAVKDIDLTIPQGAMVGFIGSSGSGKSTLMDLMLGLLAPTRGSILVGGSDIRTDMRGWQRQVGYVPQSIFLTDDSLLKNVAFGVPEHDIDLARVEQAIAAARLSDFVATLPEGLNTTVGERGVRLSGGQRQRIGIARALYADPPVLVLDEATSALDGPTEREVMDAVLTLHGTKTIIIVAHRLSTVESCDVIWKLDDGRVVAQGDFRQVMNAST
jgi:ABC-type multidrug transport system fused ATPase/permease subunit